MAMSEQRKDTREKLSEWLTELPARRWWDFKPLPGHELSGGVSEKWDWEAGETLLVSVCHDSVPPTLPGSETWAC